MGSISFRLEARASQSAARAGILQTRSGQFATPIFMPVGTQATVKALSTEELQSVGSQILLANTYHLLLRPGPEVFRQCGGIHKFMNWPRNVLTDSGGFQIFSLPHSRKISEEGASFRSYVDGRLVHLTPETSINTQMAIDSDIMMALDQCIPSTANYQAAFEAMKLTERWAIRCLQARDNHRGSDKNPNNQGLFGIVQGACFEELRRESAQALCAMNFDGYAIGGLAVGESKSQREDYTELTAALLPADKPRYLMGVGTPIDLLEAVHRGVDMFDCILPTALAQQGVVFSWQGKLKLRRSVYRLDQRPLVEGCMCYTCKHHSRAYLHHLTKASEYMGWRLLALHNLHFYHDLMASMRRHIIENTFEAFYSKTRDSLQQEDLEYPIATSKPRRDHKPKLGEFRIIQSPLGHHSIIHETSGEVLHGKSHPDEEALALYTSQAQLKERLSEGQSSSDPLIVWDVGLGAGHNAMSLIRYLQEQGDSRCRSVEIKSFECDLDVFRLAQNNAALLPHMRHPAPHYLLKNRRWQYPGIDWELLEGDFCKKFLMVPPADVIFYDPFSTHTNGPLWDQHLFAKIRSHCRQGAILLTYTASTRVRAALLASGFWVAEGVGTGIRPSTTKAFVGKPKGEPQLLGASWLQRWHRSPAAFPEGLSPAQADDFSARVCQHPQFGNSTSKDIPLVPLMMLDSCTVDQNEIK